MSFNQVPEEQGHLWAGGGGSGTYEPGQDAGGFSALAPFPRPDCPGVGTAVAVHGCPPLGIQLTVSLRV